MHIRCAQWIAWSKQVPNIRCFKRNLLGRRCVLNFQTFFSRGSSQSSPVFASAAMAPKKQSKAKKEYDYSGLEKDMRVQAEADGKWYAATVVAVSTSKNRSKAPVKVDYKGYEGYGEWLSGDRLRSKALKYCQP